MASFTLEFTLCRWATNCWLICKNESANTMTVFPLTIGSPHNSSVIIINISWEWSKLRGHADNEIWDLFLNIWRKRSADLIPSLDAVCQSFSSKMPLVTAYYTTTQEKLPISAFKEFDTTPSFTNVSLNLILEQELFCSFKTSNNHLQQNAYPSLFSTQLPWGKNSDQSDLFANTDP